MGGIKNYVTRASRGVAATLRTPPYSPPGHFYSPSTSKADRERAITQAPPYPPGIDMRGDEQIALAHKIGLTDTLPIIHLGHRYRANNGMYDYGDAAALFCMLRHYKPRRMIEVGSGYSTAATLDTAEQYMPDFQLTCIEPNPERLRARLLPEDDVEIIETPVQDVPLDRFAELQDGDVLFIDSTHVAKTGSDVVWLYLHVLPMLAPGVLVHVHDVHWRFEYPHKWILEGRDWNELYLLSAFLTHNDAWQIRLMTGWLWSQPDNPVPFSIRREPHGSLWMQRVGGAPS
jgi:predicted O-methyltransferase YrrM